MTDVSAAAGRIQAKALTRHHARSFYLASHLLTGERRNAAYALYAFCRAADDAVDEVTGTIEDEGRKRLDRMRERLDGIYAGQPQSDMDAALAEVVVRYGIERVSFDELLEGMQIDLQPVALQTTEELLRYCYLAAGVVGHLLLPVLGARTAEARDRAADLGVAMQLTNILRDVAEDLDRGRIYLPAEELAAYGLSHDDVRARRTSPEWHQFVAAQIARARSLYARSSEGIPLIQTWTGRLCTRAMSLVYGDILRAIELRGGDPFRGRAVVGKARKFQLLATAFTGRSLSTKQRPSPLLLPS